MVYKFGKILAAVRKQQGISQKDMNDRLSLSTGMINNIELCSYLPNPITAYRICDFLGIRLDEVCKLALHNVDALDDFDLISKLEQEQTKREDEILEQAYQIIKKREERTGCHVYVRRSNNPVD